MPHGFGVPPISVLLLHAVARCFNLKGIGRIQLDMFGSWEDKQVDHRHRPPAIWHRVKETCRMSISMQTNSNTFDSTENQAKALRILLRIFIVLSDFSSLFGCIFSEEGAEICCATL